jgi:two-component system chemotaxis sensor kinase CheA
MSIKQTVEELAKATALADAENLPALVEMQDAFQRLKDQIDNDDLKGLEDVAQCASELLEDIVLRQIDDTEEAFGLISQTVEYAQQVVDAVERGESATVVPSPFAPAGDDAGNALPTEAIDMELLAAWLSELDQKLQEVENAVIEVETVDDPSELIAEIRRHVHTIKGECGVLSLGEAQKHCHDAESLIDHCINANSLFPVDPVLTLVDWLKSYGSLLADDPTTAPPDATKLHDVLSVALPDGDDAAAAAPPAPETGTGASSEDDTAADAALIDAPAAASEAPAVDDDAPVTFRDDLNHDDMLNDFLCEAREHLANAEEALLELEQEPDDSELTNTVFRAFHTIKGVAGFLNLTPVVELAHNAETLLDRIRNGQIELNRDYMDLILQSCDLLSQLANALEGGTAPKQRDHANLIHRLQQAVEGNIEAAAAAAPSPPPSTTPQGDVFHPLGQIIAEMHLAEPQAVEEALQQQQAGAERLRDLLVEAGITNVQASEEALLSNSDAAALVREMLVELGFVSDEALDEAIEVAQQSGQRLGELLNLSTKDLAAALHEQRRRRRDGAPEAPAPVTPAPAKPAAPPTPAPVAPAPKAPAADKHPAQKRKVDQTVKVNTSRMDNLVTMVGELVIAQQMVVQDNHVQCLTDQRTQRNLQQVGKIIRDLQEVAMSLRMVTVRGVFQKMARLVRDISAKSGKRINFIMEGEDTELDRNVVDQIGDPLVHMIRNSCDHGIEPIDERTAAGKSESGNLTLRAYHQGGSIIIEVDDDGRGLNREKILRKAVERGVVPKDRDPNELSDKEVFNLVFLPGFSTADKVTDISGRGVGMDVVRRNIEALRGKVEIESTPGQGSIFRMRLPLTMAIIDGMVVRVGTQRYVLPTLAIEQSFQPTDDQIHTVALRGEMARVRGDLLPIYRLKRVFRLNEGIDEACEALLIVIESTGSRCSLLVDEILGQQQVVIKSLGQGIGRLPGVAGGAILGDGRVALILDVDGLVRLAASSHHNPAPLQGAAA